ncbi:hypothetical protein AC1031_016693 [Aphanomyces cochlioides]|nr:hypothetical protein AC1031_016693 [Aphanomyces cochlioides]
MATTAVASTADLYMSALVKVRGKNPLLAKIFTLQRVKHISRIYRRVTPWIGTTFGLVTLTLILLDSISNNWAILDFVGNAAHFRTAVANVQTSKDLASIYNFPNEFGIANLSKVGFWMNDYSVQSMASNSPDGALETCSSFAKTYSNVSNPVSLGTAEDGVTFLRGDAVSHAFTSDLN